ncbi:MAG: CBS domain-containing protein [Solirubrobacterales bacterium]|nr:CBS domain-containing protein [Solirubrobacterales bacterium]
MLQRPTVHPADLTVAQARAAFAANPKERLLLLVRDAKLVSTVTPEDVETADGSAAAAQVGTLEDRTVAPDEPLAAIHQAMLAEQRRRLAVVDPGTGELRGLLALKRSGAGFCDDAGVAAMRAARS